MKRPLLTLLLAAALSPATGSEHAHVFGVGRYRLNLDDPVRFQAYQDRLRQRYEFSRQLRFQRHWPQPSHCSISRMDLYRMMSPYSYDRGYDAYPPERTLRMTPLSRNDGGSPE